MNWVRSGLGSFRQAVVKGLPTIGTALAGLTAGVVLVISCNLGPSISMAGGTSGGTGSGGTGAGSTGGDTTGGGGGGSTGGGSGSCECTFSGPVTLAGPVTISGPVNNIPASEDSGQLVSSQLQHTGTGLADGAFDCSAIVRPGFQNQTIFGASCVKLLDGPFVLTDLSTAQGLGIGAAFMFAAPPSASWTSDTQPQWSLTQVVGTSSAAATYSGMRYLVAPGNSLYAVSDITGANPGSSAPVTFNWGGFKPYH